MLMMDEEQNPSGKPMRMSASTGKNKDTYII